MTMEDQTEQGAPPVLGEVSAEVKGVLEEEHKAARKRAEVLDKGEVKPPPKTLKGQRTFIAPIEKNTRFLVKAGEVVFFRDPGSPLGRRETSREGDKWAEFSNGILTTEDPDVIAWCEAHGDICRDLAHPLTKDWAELKESQVPMANREAMVRPSLDIDGLLYGKEK